MTDVSETVRVRSEDGVVTVSWRRPPLNVFDRATLVCLSEATKTRALEDAHLLVLRGEGGSWSAGLAVEDHLGEQLRPMLGAFRAALRAVWDVPVPTLAVVEGPCLGGGLELLLPCDMALAASSATFGQPEVKLGVFPPAALVALPLQVGEKVAADLLYSGRTIPAARAAEVGLVSRTVPSEELEHELARTATGFSSLRRETLVLMKRLRRAVGPFPWEALARAEDQYREELAKLPASEEGLVAFLEKRPARWPARG